MSKPSRLPAETVRHVATTCLCLAAQRTARALARRFDAAFRPVGLTNGQFSLMMALNREPPARVGELAAFLTMDRTTVTAAVRALSRQGLVEARADRDDRRNRRITLTPAGHKRLAMALPLWQAEHARLEQTLPDGANPRDALRAPAG